MAADQLLALCLSQPIKNGASIRKDAIAATAIQIIDRFLFQLYKRQPHPEQKAIKHAKRLLYEDLLVDKAHQIEVTLQ